MRPLGTKLRPLDTGRPCQQDAGDPLRQGRQAELPVWTMSGVWRF